MLKIHELLDVCVCDPSRLIGAQSIHSLVIFATLPTVPLLVKHFRIYFADANHPAVRSHSCTRQLFTFTSTHRLHFRSTTPHNCDKTIVAMREQLHVHRLRQERGQLNFVSLPESICFIQRQCRHSIKNHCNNPVALLSHAHAKLNTTQRINGLDLPCPRATQLV